MGGLSPASLYAKEGSLLASANVFKTGGEAEINTELTLMPEIFKQKGYGTYAVGKWHNDIQSFNRGFNGSSKLFFGSMSDQERVPVHEYQGDEVYDSENAEV